MGDLGGVTEVLLICFNFLLLPISEHSFTLQAIRKLYMARTSDDTIFKEVDEPYKCAKLARKNSVLSNQAEKELNKHRTIKINLKDSSLLYIANTLGCLFPNCCWRKKIKL